MRTRRQAFWALAAAASLGTAIGCSDSAGDAASRPRSSRRRARETAKRARTRRRRRPSQPVAPEPMIDPISGVAQIDTGFVYDPTGKRDPFRSFVWDRPDKMAPVAEAGPLGQFDLSQLEVVAVVWRTGNARALVEDPSGESYIVGEGAAIGKNRGHVVSIDDNTVDRERDVRRLPGSGNGQGYRDAHAFERGGMSSMRKGNTVGFQVAIAAALAGVIAVGTFACASSSAPPSDSASAPSRSSTFS